MKTHLSISAFKLWTSLMSNLGFKLAHNYWSRKNPAFTVENIEVWIRIILWNLTPRALWSREIGLLRQPNPQSKSPSDIRGWPKLSFFSIYEIFFLRRIGKTSTTMLFFLFTNIFHFTHYIIFCWQFQIPTQIFSQVQSKLFEKCWKSQRHEKIPGS